MQELSEKIRAEIRIQGAIPFHDFMELALYCPVYGFYEKEADIIGRRGDFYTSPAVGPLFGKLLGWQFAEWLFGLESERVQIMEAGAHDGTLARDILEWFERERPEVFERLEYRILEPSAARRARQEKKLNGFGPKLSWFEGWENAAPVNGVIFSNELLDAMPVHRLGWDAQGKRWFEWGVEWKNDRFAWVRLPELSASAAQALPETPRELANILPEGFSTEVCPTAATWWRQAAHTLGGGKLVAIDYGLDEEGLLKSERNQGTLRGYRQHHVVADVLADPGDQDITAHVNFSALKRVGEAGGLLTEPVKTQGQFLTEIFAAICKREGQPKWSTEQVRQFQTLTHPEHLGRTFRVLLQTQTRPSALQGM